MVAYVVFTREKMRNANTPLRWGRFVDARYLLSRRAWFVSLPDPGPGKEQPLRGVGC
jgi:hypothetical protein